MAVRVAVILALTFSVSALTACGDDDSGADVDASAGIDAGADADAATPDAGPPPDAEPPPAVVDCETSIAAPTDGICDLGAAGSDDSVLVRGDVLAGDQVLLGGSVLIDGTTGRIQCVGCDCSDSTAYATATRIDCAGAVVSPGLFNPHDHLTFSENGPAGHGTQRYDHRHDWRGSISTPINPNGTGTTSNGNRWVEIRQAMAGTTSMVGYGEATGMVRNLDRGDREPGLGAVEFATFPLGDSNESFHADCGWNFRDEELDVAAFPAYLPHVAEGHDTYAAEEFRCQSSSFDGGRDFVEDNVAHIHGIGLKANDYDKMARDGAGLIWSPRSNIDLYGMTADVVTFHRLGGEIAVGTDWIYSGSVNILRELACADSLNQTHYDGYFTDKQLWEMATINAARQLAADEDLGSLAVDKLGDVAVFAGGSDYYRAVLEAGADDVALVLRRGAPLYGEAEIVGALGTCEALDVCGQARAICANEQFGTAYGTIASATAGSYPAFFCGTPTNEPTCAPSRPGEYDGVTADDSDGDGVPNGDDNCPTVFNPIRIIDEGAQVDADGDGIGDPCDPTPLLADIDGDGVANDDDNCPFDANESQTDGDEDGKGDTCDFCPTVPNPVGVCPPPPAMEAEIQDIQNGTIAVGSTVRVTGAVVTAITTSQVVVQDPTPSGSAAFSGVRVFLGTTPATIAIGDIVDVQGTIEEYFGDTELDATIITETGVGTPIEPTALTLAAAVDEQWEGVLVTITDGAVTDAAFDCSVTPPCADANLWEIGGASGVVVWDRYYQDADWGSQIGQLPVTGIMTYRFDRRRIAPRTAADFGN